VKHDSKSHNSSTRTDEGSDTIGSSSSDVPPEYMKPAITEFRLQNLRNI